MVLAVTSNVEAVNVRVGSRILVSATGEPDSVALILAVVAVTRVIDLAASTLQ